MDPARYALVKDLFMAALEMTPGERAAWVCERCAGDEDLLREVQSLLACEQSSSELMAEPAAAWVAGAFDAEGDEDWLIGREIGHYRLARRIGAGGMGVVYLAERTGEFEQQVAVKLLPAGAGSGAVLARFRQERQILARLEHPGIARLLDGGATEDGAPYFVMEYVAGEPVDHYCDSRDLGVPERLRLFRAICDAVHFAHQNLVVHRDIKPGNILVTLAGVPKLLDFGIARLLAARESADTGLTQAGVRVMTPEYASPEQVRGLPATTATDVYLLGLLLYRLLAGRLPYRLDNASPGEIERAVCERDLPRPSTTAADPRRARLLAGDLDVIVARATEKEPGRRYASVEHLSEDIRRNLEGLPIHARPQTFFYRAGRFARRNRLAAAGAAVVAISLLGGVVAATWSASVAHRERARAERRFNDVRRLATTYLFDLHDSIKDLPGSTEARRLLVQRALESLDGLERESAGDRGLQLELAEAWLRLAEVQGHPYSSNLGDTKGALASYARSANVASAVLREDQGNAPATRTLARSQQQQADVLSLSGRPQEALRLIREAVERFESLNRAHPAEAAFGIDLASGLEALGDTLGHPALAALTDREGAAAAYRRSLEVWNNVLRIQPDNARARRAAAILEMKQGDMEMGVERLDAARAFYRGALEKIAAAGPSNENLRVAAGIRRKLAWILSYTSVPGAMRLYREAIDGFERIVKLDPKSARARMDLAIVLREAGQVQESAESGKRAAAGFYKRAVEELTALAVAADDVPRRQLAAEMRLRLGWLYNDAGDREAARRMTAQSLAAAHRLAELPEAPARLQAFYAEALLRAVPEDLRNPTEALRRARRASAIAGKASPEFLELEAEACYQSGDAARARDAIRKAISLLPPESARQSRLRERLRSYGEPASRKTHPLR